MHNVVSLHPPAFWGGVQGVGWESFFKIPLSRSILLGFHTALFYSFIFVDLPKVISGYRQYFFIVVTITT